MYLDEKTIPGLPIEARPLESWQKLLLDGADYIERHGWWDGGEKRDERQSCVVLALAKIDGFGRVSPDYETAYNKMVDYVGYISLPTWNDSHAGSGERVIAAMRACALKG